MTETSITPPPPLASQSPTIAPPHPSPPSSSSLTSKKRPLIKISTSKKKKKRRKTATTAAVDNPPSEQSKENGIGTNKTKNNGIITYRFPSILQTNSSASRWTTSTDDSTANPSPTPPHPPQTLPCDVLLSLQSLIQSNTAAPYPLLPSNPTDALKHTCHAPPIPFVLRPMIHHSLRSSSLGKSPDEEANGGSYDDGDQRSSAYSSTGVRMEMNALIDGGELRMMYLHGCGGGEEEDVAVMEGREYRRAVWDAHRFHRSGLGAAERDGDGPSGGDGGDGGTGRGGLEEKGVVVGAFVRSDGWSWADLCVTDVQLLKELATALLRHRRSSTKDVVDSTEVLPTNLQFMRDIASWAVEYLVSIQILLPRNNTNNLTGPISSYWFTLPKMAAVSRSISSGRTRMMAMIKRSSYGEVKRVVLERRERKQKSGEIVIGGGFFVKDLLARGKVGVRCMPSGQFIRLL